MARLLSDWLRSYLEFTALSESPELFHFWTGVSTIASALKRRVWIDQRYFEWTPNFYIIFVAPAGVASKSTTIGIGTSLLREVEGVNFGPDSGTWQAIGKSLMEAQELIPKTPGDLEGEMEEMSCITCTPGELGTFLDFSDRKLVDTLTSLWDGQRTSFEHRTATAGTIYIKNPWINIISATTPAWLKKNVPEEAIGGGFASRVIFVFADRKRQLVAYPGLASVDRKYEHLRESLIHDLQDMAQMLGEMILSPDAIRWGEEWYQQHWNERPTHMASERFDGYIARKQTHIHKLAMILSASRSSNRVIEKEHLEAAAQIVTGMEADMISVFESIGVAPTTRLMHEILSFLDTYNKQDLAVTTQTLYRHCFQIMSQQDFEEAFNAAIKAGYIEQRQGQDGAIYVRLKVSLGEVGRSSGQTEPAPRPDKVLGFPKTQTPDT